MMAVMPSDCMLPKSTTINCGLQAGLPGVVAFKREAI